LTLTKTYIDGGQWYDNDLPGLQTAVFVNGPVNNASTGDFPDSYWSVEIALPLKAYVSNETVAKAPPKDGDLWRINFSRVEWNVTVVDGKYWKLPTPCHNWVWAPQGVVNMHLPERWGYLEFSTAPANSTTFSGDPAFPLKLVLRTMYYWMQMYRSIAGYFPSAMSEFYDLPNWIMDGSLGTEVPRIHRDSTVSVKFASGHGGAASRLVGYIQMDRYTYFDSN
jgi:hypothetical protein